MQTVKIRKGPLHRLRMAACYSGRFVSGRPMSGRRKTDATFLRSGTTKFADADRITRWSYLPEWQRAATRLGTGTVITLLIVGYVLAPVLTLVILSTAVTGGGACIGRRLWQGRPERELRREVVRPMWRALQAHGVKRLDWIQVPLGYQEDKEAAVRVRLPDHWTGDPQDQKAFAGIVQRKLGGTWDAHWTHVGRPSVRFNHAPMPPRRVLFVDVLDEVRELPEGQLLLGLNPRRSSVVIDLNDETPHVALSVGTGGGKSATLALLIVQLLAQGATVEGIDPKRISLNPLRGLPGLTIYREIEQQWNSITMVRAEMERRYRVLDTDDQAQFPRLVLVIEEANSFYIDSADYWEETKPKGSGKVPGIYRHLNAILNKGRQANVNVITVFQEMTAQVSGGGSARSQYGFKVLGRFAPQAWKMLVDTYPRPANTTVPGQVVVATGGTHQLVQTAYALQDKSNLTPEAWSHALAGREAVVPASQVSQGVTDLAIGPGTVPVEPVGLAEAVSSGVLTVSLESARAARKRDREFPSPADTSGPEHLYDPAALTRWQANRPKSGQNTDREYVS